MTYAEAEETVKKANEGPWRNSMSEEAGPVGFGKKVKKERPTGKSSVESLDSADDSFSYDEVVWSGLQARVWWYA